MRCDRCSLVKSTFTLVTLIVLQSCTVNPPEQNEPIQPKEVKPIGDHIEVLAVSGGGHRAAHYALGTLLALDSISFNESTLLAEIDVVSSVSGGSAGIATYLASYANRSLCKEPRLSARELLKMNRDRLELLASAWLDELASDYVISLSPRDVSNFDVLEQAYFSELTKLNPCDDGEATQPLNYLQISHVLKRSEMIPFEHVVNATNSKSGRVFAFASLDAEEIAEKVTRYDDVTCILWRGSQKPVSPGEIPYSLALTASAAFPPLVKDGTLIIGDDQDRCPEGNGFLRLTDGGQADDNGITSALKRIEQHFSEALSPDRGAETVPENDSKDDETKSVKAMLLSLDNLIDTSVDVEEEWKNDGKLKIAIFRNADLPRYTQKRFHKEELETCVNDCSRRESSMFQSNVGSNALFGVSIGFSEDKDHPSELAFSVDEDGRGSKISTFANSTGLTVDQRISSVAEGYFQTMKRLLDISGPREENVKSAAMILAYDIQCAGLNRGEKGFFACQDYLAEERAILGECFLSDSRTISLQISNYCGKPMESRYLQATNFSVFNEIQKRETRVAFDKAMQTQRDRYIGQVIADLESQLESSRSSVTIAVENAKSAWAKLIDTIGQVQAKELDSTLDRVQLSPEIRQEFLALDQEIRAYLENHRATFLQIEALTIAPDLVSYDWELNQPKHCIYEVGSSSYKSESSVCDEGDVRLLDETSVSNHCTVSHEELGDLLYQPGNCEAVEMVACENPSQSEEHLLIGDECVPKTSIRIQGSEIVKTACSYYIDENEIHSEVVSGSGCPSPTISYVESTSPCYYQGHGFEIVVNADSCPSELPEDVKVKFRELPDERDYLTRFKDWIASLFNSDAEQANDSALNAYREELNRLEEYATRENGWENLGNRFADFAAEVDHECENLVGLRETVKEKLDLLNGTGTIELRRAGERLLGENVPELSAKDCSFSDQVAELRLKNSKLNVDNMKRTVLAFGERKDRFNKILSSEDPLEVGEVDRNLNQQLRNIERVETLLAGLELPDTTEDALKQTFDNPGAFSIRIPMLEKPNADIRESICNLGLSGNLCGNSEHSDQLNAAIEEFIHYSETVVASVEAIGKPGRKEWRFETGKFDICKKQLQEQLEYAIAQQQVGSLNSYLSHVPVAPDTASCALLPAPDA